MEFIVTSSDIRENEGAQLLFEKLKAIASKREGYCYYKYPIAGGFNSQIPDIVIADLEYGVCLLSFWSHIRLEDIVEIDDYDWTIKGKVQDSPVLLLEDYVINLKAKYDKYRPIRNRVEINYFVVFPLIKRSDFAKKFSDYDIIQNCRFADEFESAYESYFPEKATFLNKDMKRMFLSVTQGAGRLNEFKKLTEGATSNQIGEAVKLIDTKIAYLDKQQHAAAIQIPDGPQRIRGMAGTGKTIILTMKAAFLHSRYPEKKILYTFNTQSLYNQVRDLITKFYRETEEKDPNWANLMVMHAWGGKAKEGVYSRTCLRNSITPSPFVRNSQSGSFNNLCLDALSHPLLEEYDFVLMDEAQDFPPSFFQMIYKLTFDPKRIIFAYDELQSLNKLAISDTGELFGYEKDGSKVVDFKEGTYANNIEMDFILKKSYRNPLEVLMTAHSIGLGLYNKDGFMQIIDSTEVWNAIGYDVLNGEFKTPDEDIIIERPKQNSVSLAQELYSGTRKSLEVQNFDDRPSEIKWIASQIEEDVKIEKVRPEHILVISINQQRIEDFFLPLQNLLHSKNVPSIIPGVGGVDRDKFGEPGFVTLSTVYKAKGNEAFIVYVMAFDYLYDFVDFVTARNRAFTSISRSKGWCRITGSGNKMKRAITEITDTKANIPKFIFKFPDPKKVQRKLSQEETAKRLHERQLGDKAIEDLLKIDGQAIELTDAQKLELKKKFGL
jgi:superfamily I DNA and RNA helicase